MGKIKILVAQELSQNGQDILTGEGFHVDYRPKIDREELLSVIGDYDALIVRSLPTVDEELYERAERLRVVGRAGNGVDNIELDGATKRGIIVVNTPEANSISACELTCGLIMALCRNITRANTAIKGGTWVRLPFQGMELDGKTLGIIGLGRIGSAVATRMAGFRMKVIAYDPYITDARFQKFNAEKKNTLDELLAESDIITVHTPKTEETFGMIGMEQMKKVKPHVRFINCARGGIINEDALFHALENGLIAGAACDTMLKEPCLDSPLYKFDNFIVTPHIGANTDEAQDLVGLTVARQVASALKGEIVPNAVNLPVVLTYQELAELGPYLRLAEILGKLHHQLQKAPVERVEISFCGNVASMETEILTLAALKGLFEPILKERVNYVNARLVAESRGITVVQHKDCEMGSFTGLIRISVYSAEQKHTYSGTAFGKDELRITGINGFAFDLHPEHRLLVVENIDAPGMIGNIGMILGKSDINIAGMQVSRNKKQEAVMAITVDSDVPKRQLEDIRGIDGIKRANLVKL
ncbi:MAG: phosphoglycerate dehydrogenase [Clostridiales bacterium]|nr:phosphoglycerate dehydrogenase [Clostridiales bacterium]